MSDCTKCHRAASHYCRECFEGELAQARREITLLRGLAEVVQDLVKLETEAHGLGVSTGIKELDRDRELVWNNLCQMSEDYHAAYPKGEKV